MNSKTAKQVFTDWEKSRITNKEAITLLTEIGTQEAKGYMEVIEETSRELVRVAFPQFAHLNGKQPETVKQELRVSVIVNPPSEPRYYHVPDLLTALIVIDAIADEHNEFGDGVVDANIIGLEVFTTDPIPEWVEWEDVEGDTIDRYSFDSASFDVQKDE